MLDRSVPPRAYPTDKLNIAYPEIQNTGSTRGMLIAAREHDIVNLELIFDSGKSREIYPGLSFLTIKMLQEGTHKRNAEGITMALESLGSFLEIHSGVDRTSIKLFSLKKHFHSSFDIIQEIITQPSFPQQELEILKTIRTSQIRQQLAKNNQFATLKFNEIYFGKDHPVGRLPDTKAIDRIDVNMVRSYYERNLFQNPSFILSGNFDQQELRMVSDFVASIHPGGDGNKPDHIRATKWGEVNISREKSQQSSIRVGGETLSRKHPDFHRLYVANTLLGGFFGSRLMQNIREKKGLTYGIYSTLVNTRSENYWLIGSELAQNKVNETLVEILAETENLATNGPDPKELELLKNYLRGKLMMSLDSVFGRVTVFRKIFVDDLPIQHLDDHLTTINTITSNDISESMSKYFLGEQKISLIVG